MEDFMISQKIQGLNGATDDLFAVFDGHGGYLVSLFCKVTFPEVFAYVLEEISKQVDIEDLGDDWETFIIKESLS